MIPAMAKAELIIAVGAMETRANRAMPTGVAKDLGPDDKRWISHAPHIAARVVPMLLQPACKTERASAVADATAAK